MERQPKLLEEKRPILNNYQSYFILGLQPSASINEVKANYRKLALKHHPDRSHSHIDEEKFKSETEAYHTLLNYYNNVANSKPNYDLLYDILNEKPAKTYDFNSRKHLWLKYVFRTLKKSLDKL